MHNKDRLYLEDIISSIESIKIYTKDINYKEFVKDCKTYSATIRDYKLSEIK